MEVSGSQETLPMRNRRARLPEFACLRSCSDKCREWFPEIGWFLWLVRGLKNSHNSPQSYHYYSKIFPEDSALLLVENSKELREESTGDWREFAQLSSIRKMTVAARIYKIRFITSELEKQPTSAVASFCQMLLPHFHLLIDAQVPRPLS